MTQDDHTRRSVLLTAKEIATLNRAREVLKRLDDTAWRRSLEHYDPFADVTAWDLGRLSGAASGAEDALFEVLSTARNCGAKITDAQVRGTLSARDDGETQGEPAPCEATPHVRALPAEAEPSHRERPTSTGGARGPIRAV